MKKLFMRLAVGAAFVAAAVSAHAGQTLDRVMEKKAMVVATNSGWPPQSYLDDNNEMVGFDIDVSREIAKRLGVSASTLDHWLWQRGQAPEYKARPRHRCRNVYY